MQNRTLGSTLLFMGGILLVASLLLIGPPGSTTGAIIGLIVFIVGLMMVLNAPSEVEEAMEAAPVTPVTERVTIAPSMPVPATRDDLTKIEGIGPKLQTILYEQGFETFSALGEATPTAITYAVKAGGFKAPFNAETWPQQATLAAKGEWDALSELQDQLKGGRA